MKVGGVMLHKVRNKRNKIDLLPYSKQLLEYSRIECWIMTIALFVFQFMGKDTGQLYQICLAGWGGYAVAKALYYNMAKSDHQIQLLNTLNQETKDKAKTVITDNLVDKLKETIKKELE